MRGVTRLPGSRLRTSVRALLAIVVVGVVTALGATFAPLIGWAAHALMPTVSGTDVAVLAAVLGFGLSWWWFALGGQRWMDGHGEETP